MSDTATKYLGIAKAPSISNYTQIVVCPICGDDWVHSKGDAFKIEGYEEAPYDGVLPRRKSYRGNGTAIRFWSENCEHQWELIIQFHKGQTFVYTNQLKDRTLLNG